MKVVKISDEAYEALKRLSERLPGKPKLASLASEAIVEYSKGKRRVYLATYPEFIHPGLTRVSVKVFRELEEARSFIRGLLEKGEVSEEEVQLYECDLDRLECMERKF